MLLASTLQLSHSAAAKFSAAPQSTSPPSKPVTCALPSASTAASAVGVTPPPPPPPLPPPLLEHGSGESNPTRDHGEGLDCGPQKLLGKPGGSRSRPRPPPPPPRRSRKPPGTSVGAATQPQGAVSLMEVAVLASERVLLHEVEVEVEVETGRGAPQEQSHDGGPSVQSTQDTAGGAVLCEEPGNKVEREMLSPQSEQPVSPECGEMMQRLQAKGDDDGEGVEERADGEPLEAAHREEQAQSEESAGMTSPCEDPVADEYLEGPQLSADGIGDERRPEEVQEEEVVPVGEQDSGGRVVGPAEDVEEEEEVPKNGSVRDPLVSAHGAGTEQLHGNAMVAGTPPGSLLDVLDSLEGTEEGTQDLSMVVGAVMAKVAGLMEEQQLAREEVHVRNLLQPFLVQPPHAVRSQDGVPALHFLWTSGYWLYQQCSLEAASPRLSDHIMKVCLY